MDEPRYLLSGINEYAQRVGLTLEPYLRPLKQPIVVTDVDSVLYIGDGIPTTNDISWIVHSVYDNNITENIHMQVKLNGVDWQIKELPNMFIGRFSQNNIYTIHIVFPGLRRQDNGKWINGVTPAEKRDFYDIVFYPALRQVLPPTE